MELGLLFLLLLAKAQNFFGGGDDKPKPHPSTPPHPAGKPPVVVPPAKTPAQQQAQAARTPVPWPQALPPDLPPFPAGWKAASPVTSAMVSRAFQLLPQLWEHGMGTWKPEKTGDRWVVYQAANTKGADGVIKKGVVAFTAPSLAPATFSTAPPTVTPGAALPTRPGTVPASHVAPPTLLPTLRTGSKGPSVVWLQQQLHIGADGSFGPATKTAVIAFQAKHGLTADGIVGPATWAALGGRPAQAA